MSTEKRAREFYIAGTSDGGFSAHELPGCGDMSGYHRAVKVREVIDGVRSVTANQIRMAFGQAMGAPENSHKELDSQICEALIRALGIEVKE